MKAFSLWLPNLEIGLLRIARNQAGLEIPNFLFGLFNVY